MTRASLREYAAVQRPRDQQAPRAEKHRLLDEIVAVTGLHRQAAIRLLPGTPAAARAGAGRAPAGVRPGDRRRRRGPVAGLRPDRGPSPPPLRARAPRAAHPVGRTGPPAVDKRLRQASRPTLARLLAPTRAQYPRRGRRPPGPAPSSSTRSPSGPSRSGKMPAPASSRSIWSRLVAPPPKASTSVPSARSTSPPPGSSWTPSAVHALYEVQWCGAELRRCRPAGFRGQYSLRGRVVPLLS